MTNNEWDNQGDIIISMWSRQEWEKQKKILITLFRNIFIVYMFETTCLSLHCKCNDV